LLTEVLASSDVEGFLDRPANALDLSLAQAVEDAFKLLFLEIIDSGSFTR